MHGQADPSTTLLNGDSVFASLPQLCALHGLHPLLDDSSILHCHTAAHSFLSTNAGCSFSLSLYLLSDPPSTKAFSIPLCTSIYFNLIAIYTKTNCRALQSTCPCAPGFMTSSKILAISVMSLKSYTIYAACASIRSFCTFYSGFAGNKCSTSSEILFNGMHLLFHQYLNSSSVIVHNKSIAMRILLIAVLPSLLKVKDTAGSPNSPISSSSIFCKPAVCSGLKSR